MARAADAGQDDLRLRALWRYELRVVRGAGWRGPVAGIDEAGRGPLAGPVVAAAVILPRRLRLPRLDDSKRLSPTVREELYALITAGARAWAACAVDVADIDRLNILEATRLAMRWALLGLSRKPAGAVVDGWPVPELGCPQVAVIDGDALCASVAAASVVAKVTRDRLMCLLDRRYPEYGFSRHKGYCTPEHRQALLRFGPCPAHRRSFTLPGPTLFEPPPGGRS